MHTTDTCLDKSTPFPRTFPLICLHPDEPTEPAPISKHQEEETDEARHAREAAFLLRQISTKAPQLASVLELLNEGEQRARDMHATRDMCGLPPLPQQPQKKRRGKRLLGGGALLDTATGVLSHAFPGVAPLFHGCCTFLQLALIKKKKQI